ncbi:DUF2065 domain-containing protein [Oxalobacteraceae bacterium OM1]|nr:DUF2065 domain-containing protein [Oxalobacteraceae bacterium OM1]
MDHTWILALGLALLLEGGLPFFFPRQWREVVSRIAALADGQIRFIGLIAILCGSALLILQTLLS